MDTATVLNGGQLMVLSRLLEDYSQESQAEDANEDKLLGARQLELPDDRERKDHDDNVSDNVEDAVEEP